MRYRVSEGLQFLVTGFQIGGSFFQLLVELANFLLPVLPVADVVIRFQNGDGTPLLILAQRLSAGYEYAGSVGCRLP